MWKKVTAEEYLNLQTADHKVVDTQAGQDESGLYLDVELDGPCRLKHRLRPSMTIKDYSFWGVELAV